MNNESDAQNEPQNQLGIKEEQVDDKKQAIGSRALNLLKAALSILRRKGNNGKPPTPPMSTNNTSALTRLVGCVRPLYLEGGAICKSPPQVLEDQPTGTISRYASAQSLCDLDDGGVANNDDNNNNDYNNNNVSNAEVFYDGIEGDEMIDAKADEFIAKFYEQMKNDRQQDTE